MNTHINNINGDDLIPLAIVGKEYWTRSYFYNIGHFDGLMNINSYGFYWIGKGKFVDEYGDVLTSKPDLYGSFGVTAIIGIARQITKELIIRSYINLMDELPFRTNPIAHIDIYRF